MSLIIGQSGSLELKDSDVRFENWEIYADIVGTNEPGQSAWSGNFEIPKSDFVKVFPLVSQQVGADFYGKANYNGKIIIIQVPIGSSTDPIVVDFIGTGRLEKSSTPQETPQ